MAEINIKHFASKTLPYRRTVDWESILVELFVGSMLGVFAYIGYSGGLVLLFILCTIGLFLSFLSFARRIYIRVRFGGETKD